MNKGLVSASLAIWLFTSGLPAALAADSGAEVITGITEAGKEATTDKQLPSSFVSPRALVVLERLDLPGVWSRAVDSSFNLSLLQLKNKALITQQQDLKTKIQGLEYTQKDAFAIPATPKDILESERYKIPADAAPDQLFWMGPVLEMNTVFNSLMSGQVESMNEMVVSQRVQMESSVKQLERERLKSALDLEEAAEGTKLQVTGQYIQLLSLKQQTALLQEGLKVLNNELVRMEALQEQGLAAADKYRDLQLEATKQSAELQTLKNNYQMSLLQFSFDLGIRYDPNIPIDDISLPEVKPVIRKTSEEILTHSYELKRLWNTLNQAAHEEKFTPASNAYAKESLKQNVQMIDEQIKQAKQQLNKNINSTYAGADSAYQQYETAQQDLKKAAADDDAVNLRYKVGAVSLHDLNSSSFQLHQAEDKTKLLRLQYFGILGKIEAMEKGLILSGE